MYSKFVLIVFLGIVSVGCKTAPLNSAEITPIASGKSTGTRTDSETPIEKRTRLIRLKNQLVDQYRNRIKKTVGRQFRPPSGVWGSCEVLVSVEWPGKVTGVEITTCKNESSRLKNAIRKAIRAAQPLPEPPHRAVFNSEIMLIFTAPKW